MARSWRTKRWRLWSPLLALAFCKSHARTQARAHMHARTTHANAPTHTRRHARTHARTHSRTHAHTHAQCATQITHINTSQHKIAPHALTLTYTLTRQTPQLYTLKTKNKKIDYIFLNIGICSISAIRLSLTWRLKAWIPLQSHSMSQRYATQ